MDYDEPESAQDAHASTLANDETVYDKGSRNKKSGSSCYNSKHVRSQQSRSQESRSQQSRSQESLKKK